MLGNIMEKLKAFMYGRYGNDALNVALTVFGCVLTLILSLFRLPFFVRYICYIPYFVAVFRALSKNIDARRRENEKFLKVSEPWRKYLTSKMRQFQDKDHKYYHCPKCHNVLRVPSGRGKIKISCPHCRKEFIKNTGKPNYQ